MKNKVQIPYTPFSGKVFYFGLTPEMPSYIYIQGYVFNILNMAGIVLSLMRVIYITLFSHVNYPASLILINLLPTFGGLLLMLFMYKRLYVAVVFASFIIYPLLILFLGVYTHDRGVLLYLIPYLAYPFYFLHSKKKIIPVFLFVTAAFILGLILEVSLGSNIPFIGASRDYGLEIVSLTGAVVLMFFSLFSIKYQIWGYQRKIKRQSTELKEKNIEIELQRKKLEESNLVKDKLFSIISHDLKAPLLGLTALIEIESQEESDHLLKYTLPELKKELKKTSELFENLLNWAKLQLQDAHITSEKIDIGEIAEKVSDSLQNKAQAKGIEIKNELSNTYITCDKDILEIVIRNITSNAIKFSSQNGVIKISGKPDKNNFEIKVTDNGKGISADALRRIREKTFYTTNGTGGEKGTGLGLIICSDLIEKCKGTLSIESETGVGTSISISLPQ